MIQEPISHSYTCGESICSFVEKSYNSLGNAVHLIATNALSLIQGPEFAIKILQSSIETIEVVAGSVVEPHLKWSKSIIKDIKTIFYFIKGFRSIDDLINFKVKLETAVLNISGLVLFAISSISLAEKFSFNISAIKTALAAIPIFGVLPFGGLLNFSLLGISANVLYLSKNKRAQINQSIERIEKKIEFWKKPLDRDKVQAKKKRMEEKIAILLKNIDEKNRQYIQCNNAKKTWKTSEVLKQLSTDIGMQKGVLKTLVKKCHQFDALEKNFYQINAEELESFQKAKNVKWSKKLERSVKERYENSLAIVKAVSGIAKHLLVLSSAAAGVVVAPIAYFGITLFDTAIGVKKHFLKESIRKMEFLPVKINHHLKFNDAVESNKIAALI